MVNMQLQTHTGVLFNPTPYGSDATICCFGFRLTLLATYCWDPTTAEYQSDATICCFGFRLTWLATYYWDPTTAEYQSNDSNANLILLYHPRAQ
jgi:hypothetical protein